MIWEQGVNYCPFEKSNTNYLYVLSFVGVYLIMLKKQMMQNHIKEPKNYPLEYK